jgi:exonuclease VII small subunit
VELDAEIDRLYGLPLEEFVSERDELAKRLRSDGDREAAERVKGLRKPTLGAWALNQAVRRQRDERDELLAAGERLRAAHEALLSGGDRSVLREAVERERALVSALADAAQAIAGTGGPALKERLRGTLHAAAVDEDIRQELAVGRVVHEREAAGLGAFGTVIAAPPVAERRSRTDADTDGHVERLATAERALDEARTALAEAEAAQDRAARELESARQALDDAQASERETRATLRERVREVAKREREVERLRSKSR